MILSGIKCDICSRTEIIRFENEEIIKILYATKGWKINNNATLCPFCLTKEIANNINDRSLLLKTQGN